MSFAISALARATIPTRSKRISGSRHCCRLATRHANSRRCSAPPTRKTPPSVYGRLKRVLVKIKSVTFPNTSTSIVRFSTTEKSGHGIDRASLDFCGALPLHRYACHQRMALRKPTRLPGLQLSPRSGDGHARGGWMKRSLPCAADHGVSARLGHPGSPDAERRTARLRGHQRHLPGEQRRPGVSRPMASRR